MERDQRCNVSVTEDLEMMTTDLFGEMVRKKAPVEISVCRRNV